MHFPKVIIQLVAWIFLVLAFPPAGVGQAVFGNITGTVTDPTGAAVPNAEIAITDLDRGITYTTKTTSDGNFTQTHLLAGHYGVKVTAPGFSEFSASADVQVDETTRADAQLRVGKAVTTVTVSTEGPLLKTDRADVSNTLTANEVERLPILNRNVTTLVLALPGSQLNGFQHASSENPQGGLQINVNGQYFYSNGFELDGTENHSNILGIAVVNPNPDALQEFKVTSSNYDAEFGNVSGAMLQGTTKSGTNQYHGSAFEYLRNNVFNAADPFSHVNPPIRWNQFGGSVGGPIKKDKLFVFFAYEGTRRRDSGSEITTVPTAAERSGDLSALLGAYMCADGTTSATGCANPLKVTTTEGQTVAAQAGMVFDPRTGSPDGSGRQVVATNGQVNVLTPAAPMAKLLTYLPMPNFGPAGQTFNNYATAVGRLNDGGQYDGRIDYTISANHHLFGRYSLADFILEGPGAFGDVAGGPSPLGFAGNSHARNQSLALGYTYSITSTLFADFRFGYYRYRPHNLPNGFGKTPALDAGLLGLNTGAADTSGMPAFYVQGDGG